MPSISSSQVKILDKILSSAVESQRIPPGIFAVTTAEKTIYSKSAGNRVLDDPVSAPIDNDTIYMLCSQTKLITSIATLQLIEQGKLSLSDPVANFFPELGSVVVFTGEIKDGKKETRPAKTPIIIKHLLNHTSGLSYDLVSQPGMDDVSSYKYAKGDGPSRAFKILQQDYPGVPLNFEPGTQFYYGTSVDVLGFVIEKVSGLSLEDYFKKHIFNPLGLTASFHGNSLGDNRMSLAFRKPDKTLSVFNGELNILPQENIHLYLGGTGLYASQTTYLAVLRHILQILDGTATRPLLSLKLTQSIFAPTLPEESSPMLDAIINSSNNQFGYGLCVNPAERPGFRKAGSGSWLGWAGTFFWIDPSSGIAATFGSQLAVGYLDPQLIALFAELEQAVYAGLQA